MDIFKTRAAHPMLIGRIARPFNSEEYVYELKLDGERCLAYLDEEGVDLINQRGNRLLPKLPELGVINQNVTTRCILDGELVVAPDGKPNFELIKNRVLTSNALRINMARNRWPASFIAFDILYREGVQLTGLPWRERREELENTVREGERLSLSRYVERDGCALFEQACQHGLEGVVAKKSDSLYHMGQRTRSWAKIKNSSDDEYIVCGYIQNAEFVISLILGQYDSAGRMLYKGHVTMGRSAPDFAEVERVPRVSAPPFDGEIPSGNEGAVWIQPVLVCTVQYMLLNESGMMRHPKYKGLRPDKLPAEAVEQPRA